MTESFREREQEPQNLADDLAFLDPMAVVEIDSSPALPVSEMLAALARRGIDATIEGRNAALGHVTLTIAAAVPEVPQRILAALDDMIARAGLPLISCRVGAGAYAVHPPAG